MGTNHYPDQHDVEYYEATRYAARDQQYISRREQELIVNELRRLAAPRKNVLDAPCGYGRFSGHLVGLGFHPINSDIAGTMLARTTQSLDARGIKTEGVVGDLIHGLPFEKDAFDGAISVRMLHNVLDTADRRAVLKSFSEVVKDWLVITFYRSPPLHRAQFAVRRALKPKARQTMAMVPLRQFETEAASAGFRIEKLIPVLPVFHAQTIAVLRKA